MNVKGQNATADFSFSKLSDGTHSVRCMRCGEMIQERMESFNSVVYSSLLHTKVCVNRKEDFSAVTIRV